MIHEVIRAISAAWGPLSDRFQSQTLDWLSNTQSALTSSMYRDMQIPGRRIESDQIMGDLLKRSGGNIERFPLLRAVLTRLAIHENRQPSA